MEWQIREFQIADLTEMAVIENELFSDPWDSWMLLESCRKGTSWVMESSTGEILGYLIGELVLDEFSLYNLGISCKYQKQGLGYEFLKYLIRQLRPLNCCKIFLEVRVSNQAAIKLYEKCGFQPIYIRNRYYKNPVEDALTMVLKISPEEDSDEEL